MTDSLTPRKFSSVRTITMPTEKLTLYFKRLSGSMLKTASAPLATLNAMVST